MDHQEQHHLHHRKEREDRIEREKLAERAEEQQLRTIHPVWFLVVGTVLVFLVILAWSLV